MCGQVFLEILKISEAFAGACGGAAGHRCLPRSALSRRLNGPGPAPLPGVILTRKINFSYPGIRGYEKRGNRVFSYPGIHGYKKVDDPLNYGFYIHDFLDIKKLISSFLYP